MCGRQVKHCLQLLSTVVIAMLCYLRKCVFITSTAQTPSPRPLLVVQSRCHPHFPIFSSGASIPVIWRSREIDLFLKTTIFWALLFVSRCCWHPMTREYYANRDRSKTCDCSSRRLQNTMAHLNIVEGADKSYFGEHFYSNFTVYVLLSYQIYAFSFRRRYSSKLPNWSIRFKNRR